MIHYTYLFHGVKKIIVAVLLNLLNNRNNIGFAHDMVFLTGNLHLITPLKKHGIADRNRNRNALSIFIASLPNRNDFSFLCAFIFAHGLWNDDTPFRHPFSI